MTRTLPFLACLAVVLPASAQEAGIADAAITLSAAGRAELWFELESGTEHRLRFEGETVEVDGIGIGSYAERGDLESAWRAFLREHAGEDASAVRGGLVEFRRFLEEWSSAEEVADGEAARALAGRIDAILGLAVPAGAAPALPAGEAAPEAPGQPGPMQIVPGGLGFDVTGELDRLREALGRLGDSGEFSEGGLAMIVHGDYEVLAEATIPGDVAILDGTLRLAGGVEGDILMLDGVLVLDGDARVRGDVLQVGGEVDFGEDASSVEGEILSDIRLAPSAPSAPAAPDAPSVRQVESSEAPMQMRPPQPPGFWSRLARNFGRAVEGVIAAGSTFMVLAVLGLLLVYFGRRRLETVSDTVRLEFARSFAMGLAGEVLFVPVLLVLIALVVTWLVVPFFLLAVWLAGVFGYLAAAHASGEIFARRRFRTEWLERLRRSNSYYYVVSGLALLMLPFAAGAVLWVFGGAADFVRGLILFVAGVGTWVVVTAGFGGVLLTRAGGRSVVVDWSADSAPGEGASPRAETDPPSAPVDDA